MSTDLIPALLALLERWDVLEIELKARMEMAETVELAAHYASALMDMTAAREELVALLATALAEAAQTA